MKHVKPLIASLLLLALTTIGSVGSAWADHGHYRSHSNVYLGIGVGPYWGPSWYYPPPSYYYPPTVVVQQPPVYIEQPQSTAPPAANYWYYCPTSKRYYPYVSECPSGWQQVSPTPPGP